jgi:hypothetical protein
VVLTALAVVTRDLPNEHSPKRGPAFEIAFAFSTPCSAGKSYDDIGVLPIGWSNVDGRRTVFAHDLDPVVETSVVPESAGVVFACSSLVDEGLGLSPFGDEVLVESVSKVASGLRYRALDHQLHELNSQGVAAVARLDG